MVNAGRIACIFTPFALSIVAFICIVYLWLGGTISGNRTLGDVYFLQVTQPYSSNTVWTSAHSQNRST